MPSVAEVRVCDALSSEDAASLEEDDAPQERKPPKDFNVSFAQSVSRTANVYNSARPPSRTGVSSRSLKTRHTLPKRSDKGDAFSGGFGGSLSQVALERDPTLRRLHEDAKATRSLAKRYKAQLVLAEKAADAYRNASFEAKAKVSRLEAATRRLFSSRGDDVEKDAATTLARLDRERQASSNKLAKCEDEMADLRRANETLRRARSADRKKHRDAARAFKDELASAAAATRAARDELAAERKNARRKTLEVRTLEAKLFRPEPPSQTKTVSMNTACDSVCDSMPRLPPVARVPGDAEGSAPPQTEPELEDEEAAAAEEDTEQAHDEALTDTEIDAPVVAESEAPSRLSVPGSSSGGESSVGPDAPRVVLCVVCVEPEKAVPAPAASAKKLADAEDETNHSHVSNDVSLSFPNDDDDDEGTAGTSRRDASDAPAGSPTEAERMTREKEEEKIPRERFFFARTTVASRSRAGTLDGTLE
jgi:predicted  nucleic acid-binding Zn-ribbon protein